MSPPPIRVAFINDHLGWGGASLHGVSRFFLNLFPHLDRRRIEARLIILRAKDRLAEPFEAAGIPVDFLARRRLDPFALWPLVRLLRRRRIDLVHAQGYGGTTLARLGKRIAGVRVVIHSHDADDRYPAWMSPIDRFLSGREDAALANSGDALRFFETRRRIPLGRTRLWPNGIDLAGLRRADADTVLRLRAELGLAPDAAVVLTLTRFHPEKGNEVLLRAVPFLSRLAPQAVVVLAGDGPGLDACRRLAATLGVSDRVRFPGFRSDVAALLSLASVAVVPSLREGTCYALLEAMAMSVPVVASRVGGPAEVIEDGVSGRLVSRGDSEALAAAVGELLASPEERRRLAGAGRRQAEAHDVRIYAARLTELYALLMAGDSTGAAAA